MNDSFQLPFAFNLAATFFFALTGALAALRRGYDFIGLFALALATGMGGGLIRDGLFIQEGPPMVTQDSRYFLVTVAAGIVIIIFGPRIDRFNKAFDLLDALGLAAFSVVGAQISLDSGLTAAAAVLVGVLNACGGGLLRDILVREEPLVFKPGQFYALAAALGSGLHTLLVSQMHVSVWVSALATMLITFLFRGLAIVFNWTTSPVLRRS